jgi:two-component system CheB/CheR fusion protein
VTEQLDDPGLEELLVHLRDIRGVDFTGYKRPSVERLVTRRMRAVGAASHRDYVDLLQVEPGELRALLDTLLVNVTSFFRDETAWRVLREELLPEAIAALQPDEPVRVWSAACATGEEAYTLAMLLHDLLGGEQFARRVKVYATDIDDGALAVARVGRYTSKALESLPDGYLDRYFEPDGHDLYRFRQDLRQNIIFGRHDLLRDAPISRVLLLSCRNVLMYLQSETQRLVLERFGFALHEHGLLLLGKAEMLLTQSHLFLPIDLPNRIFRSRRTASVSRLTALAVGTQGRDVLRRVTQAAFVAGPTAQLVLDSAGMLTLLNVGAERDLGVRREDLGRPFHDLEVSFRPRELRGPVASVQAGREPMTLRDVEWLRADGATWWDIQLSPLLDADEVLGVHLSFMDVSERHALQTRLERAHDELSTAYEELQSSSEELETTNEELQSAIEELETTNEELQSTNEELETMNEELQSTNEELQTVNDELRDRTQEVYQANVFLQGILEALDIAVAVTDMRHRVQLWNAAAEELTGLRAFEIEGLSLSEARTDLPAAQMEDALSQVVDRRQPRTTVERQVTNRFGTTCLRRLQVTPLRDREGVLSGAVVTIIDLPPV